MTEQLTAHREFGDPEDLAISSSKILRESKEKPIFPQKTFTTHSKNGKRRKNKSLKYDHTIAKTYLLSLERELGLSGLFEGKMAQVCFDCPIALREAFKTETKANGSSTCQELRRFMVNYLAGSRMQKIAFGNTMSKVFDAKFSIGKMNFTQNVQSRPRRLMRDSKFSESQVDGEGIEHCCLCEGAVVGRAVLKGNGKEYAFCRVHFQEKKRDLVNWRFGGEKQ